MRPNKQKKRSGNMNKPVQTVNEARNHSRPLTPNELAKVKPHRHASARGR